MIVVNVLDMWQVGWNTNLKHQSLVNYLKCCLFCALMKNQTTLKRLYGLCFKLGMNTVWFLFLASAV